MFRVLLVFLFIFSPFCSCRAQESADFDSWDFGKIKQGQVVKHEFVLKNDSAKIIKIKDLTTSCGCTASKIRKKTLLPGESTTIEVKFNSKGYSGPVKQYVYISTDNLDKPILKFIIKAEVVKKGSFAR